MRTKVTSLLLLIILLLSACAGEAENALNIRGYNKKDGYQYVQFGSYFTDADGGRRPILWRVLRVNNGEAYMLSELILFGCPLHGDYDHYNGWESSDLYLYLNGTFKDDAFPSAQQAALLVRTEDNALVTLITSDEMKDASIGFSSNKERLCESTEWAKILQDPPLWELPKMNNKGRWKKLYVYSSGHKYSPWWSRTRSTDYKHEQRRVMNDGAVGRISVGNSDLGARPAITLDLSKVQILSGSGTKSDPFLLAVEGDDGEVTAAYQAAPTATAKPTATVKATKTPKPTKTPKATKTPKPTATPKTSAAPKATEAPSHKTSAGLVAFTSGADKAYILPEFPELTAEGFLPEGREEFVYQDEAAGLWLYASQSIRIQIQRKEGTIDEYDGKRFVKTWKTRWYETHIFCRDSGEIMDFYPVNEAKYKKRNPDVMEAEDIAKKFNLVLGFNTDYFNYRVSRQFQIKSYKIGIVMRDGQIVFDNQKKEKTSELPPLDIMAFYPDGATTVHISSHTTAEKLKKAGATDAVSFGPVLVENGAVSPRAALYGKVLNPRTAFGTVEPGHYVHLLADGRLQKSDSIKGVTCSWMAERMVEMGCDNALNLDGGASSVLVFMGKQLNKVGNYGSGAAANRDYNELLGIGHSPKVQ